MPSLSSRKAQFFVLTTVVIVGVFYTLSKYINPYAFVDTSRAASGSETFFFDNVKEKAIKTVNISSPGDLESNLARYKNFVENMASEKGYKLIFNYTIGVNDVGVNMILVSEKMTLKSNFNIPIS
jgi:hypothetical protein